MVDEKARFDFNKYDRGFHQEYLRTSIIFFHNQKIKLQLIVRHFICTNMIYYTKCRLINELNELNSIRFFDSKSLKASDESLLSTSRLSRRETKTFTEKKKKRKISSRVFAPVSVCILNYDQIKPGSHQLPFLIPP